MDIANASEAFAEITAVDWKHRSWPKGASEVSS